MDLLIGLPFIIARIVVSVITVISIFVPGVFEFDASSFPEMLICPKHLWYRMALPVKVM